MKTQKMVLRTLVLSAGILLGQVALACTAGAWLGGATGDVDPNDPDNGVARVSGFCGLKVFGTGDVKDNSPAADAIFNGRFYYFPETDTGSYMNIFVAYSDEGGTTELFSIKFNGTNLQLNAGAASGGTAEVAADTSHWNLVEFAWQSGETGSLWVNADATIDPPTATFDSGSGAVESVRLGAPMGFGDLTGMGTFDDYESRRETAIGPRMICDANNDENFSLSDILAVITEKYGSPPQLAEGQPDCDLDGDVDLSDILATIAVVYPPVP